MTRRLSNRQFDAALATAGHLYTLQECGCMALVMYDIPEVVKDSRDAILEQALKGRTLHRVPRGGLPPFRCATHEREYLARVEDEAEGMFV